MDKTLSTPNIQCIPMHPDEVRPVKCFRLRSSLYHIFNASPHAQRLKLPQFPLRLLLLDLPHDVLFRLLVVEANLWVGLEQVLLAGLELDAWIVTWLFAVLKEVHRAQHMHRIRVEPVAWDLARRDLERYGIIVLLRDVRESWHNPAQDCKVNEDVHREANAHAPKDRLSVHARVLPKE